VVIVDANGLSKVLCSLLGSESQEDARRTSCDVGDTPRGWADAAQSAAVLSGFDEAVAHWRADEHGTFLVEALCLSKWVSGPGGKLYDATLRVAFAIESPGEDRRGVGLHVVGSYWKLPDHAADALDVGAAERIISHTRGGSGTALCDVGEEQLVWSVLEKALPRVLSGIGCDIVPHLVGCYEDRPLLLAAALVRASGALLDSSADISKDALSQAEAALLHLRPPPSACQRGSRGTAPATRVQSYMLRAQGTRIARAGGSTINWSSAARFYEEAVAMLPLSAGAQYLLGKVLFSKAAFGDAAQCFARSVLADCDFSPAYSHLATSCLLKGDPQACVDIAEALILRHGRLAAAYHHLAVGLYAQEAAFGGCCVERRTRALTALQRAREFQRANSWGKEDDAMLSALEGRCPVPPVPVRTWLFHAWRM